MAVVVSDASPLICLAAIRHFDLLRLLYGEVLIPDAVWHEITRAPAFTAALGHTPAIKPLLTQLVEQHHFRLHPNLVQRVLTEADEAT
jgi:predicted nucleic acid-binding protein